MILFLISGIILLFYFLSFQDHGLRRSLIKAYLVVVVLAAAITEILSIFDLITRSAVLVAWALIGLMFLAALFFRIKGEKLRFRDLFDINLVASLRF